MKKLRFEFPVSGLFYIALSFISLLLPGCGNPHKNPYPDKIKKALDSAGANRKEIEKALDYFIKQGDSLKLEAIYFLVERMPGKYSIAPPEAGNPFHAAIVANPVSEAQAWDPAKSRMGARFDSIRAATGTLLPPKITRDIEAVTGDFLIQNVEKAFEAWHKSEKIVNCSFDDFCEYVLPYRIGNEPLTGWRELAFNKFSCLPDSIRDPIELAKAIVQKCGIYYNAGMSKYPFFPTFGELDSLHWGSCDHLAAYLTLSLRAIGIPSAVDVVPAWANRSGGHVWNVVMNKNGRFEDFGFNADGSNGILYKVPKIYRITYSGSATALRYLNPCWKDVSGQYSMPVSDVVIPRPALSKGETPFLCIFDNQGWKPVAVPAIANKKEVVFENMARGIPFNRNTIAGYENEGKGVVYLPMVFRKGVMRAFSAPVILRENGELCMLTPDYARAAPVTLYRKYPKYGHISVYAGRMAGGFFEVSRQPGFRKKEIICTIHEAPRHAITEVVLSAPVSCRYLRYRAPDGSWVNLSELQCFSGGKKLAGTPFASDKNQSPEELAKITDDNIDTYYIGEIRNAWVGIDFGKEVTIDKIAFSPRTDGNDIIPGEEYELFYWDGQWVSAGRKRADGFRLEYGGIPANVLLWLHNHTKGVEERIFTYTNNEQVWW